MICCYCPERRGRWPGGLHEDAVHSVHYLVCNSPRGGEALSFLTPNSLLFGQKRGEQWALRSMSGRGCAGTSSVADSPSLPAITVNAGTFHPVGTAPGFAYPGSSSWKHCMHPQEGISQTEHRASERHVRWCRRTGEVALASC